MANATATTGRTIKTPAFGDQFRKATSAYFDKSGIRNGGTLTQRPFLAVRDRDGRTVIEVVNNVSDLIALPRKTKVMHQWEGKTRSDYVTYTVGQLRDHVEANPPKAGQVI